MRSPEERDAVTLEIVTSLLIFVLVAAAGAVPLVVVGRVVGEGGLLDVLGPVVLGCAAVAAISHLWRHRRP